MDRASLKEGVSFDAALKVTMHTVWVGGREGGRRGRRGP